MRKNRMRRAFKKIRIQMIADSVGRISKNEQGSLFHQKYPGPADEIGGMGKKIRGENGSWCLGLQPGHQFAWSRHFPSRTGLAILFTRKSLLQPAGHSSGAAS